MTQVVVIDYGMGNLHSVSKAIQAVSSSESIVISSNTDVIKAADKIVFPGVGAIKDCMEAFSVDLRETVLEEIDKKPTLAICVGMQMLLKSSEENGGVDCFDILDGKVTKINASKEIKVPHMGWNKVKISQSNKNEFNNFEDSKFYFIHSYYAKPTLTENIVGTTVHGHEFASIIKKNNIYGVQFHPEKSHNYGKFFFKKFLNA